MYPGSFPERETTVTVEVTIAIKHRTAAALTRAKTHLRMACVDHAPSTVDETDPHRFSYRVLRCGERRNLSQRSVLVTNKLPKKRQW